MKQYKVLSQKDKWFSGKFDPELLEKALNSYAQQGWEVKGMATASMAGFLGGGNREEMVIVLERDDTRQADEAAHRARVQEAAQKSFEAPKRQPSAPSEGDNSGPPIYRL